MANPVVVTTRWRNAVLNELEPGLADCFIVEDPDRLMTEPGIQEVLIDRGFEFYPFDNSIELRYFYELKVRNKGSKELAEPLVISIDTDYASVGDLPFDITKRSRVVSLSLDDCFPDLFHEVLKCLEPEELDTLEQAITEYTPGKLGDTASRDFVLRHIYQVAPEVIQTPADLLRTLLRIHYRDIVLPDLLKLRLIDLLSKNPQFHNWPLKTIIENRQSFFCFLEEHWSEYVNAVKRSQAQGSKEPPVEYSVQPDKSSVIILPYGHDDVRVYIDNLFLEGFLKPIEIDDPKQLSNHWSLVGVKLGPEKESKKRLSGLITLCHDTLPEEDARHQVWLQFAFRWAELCAIYHSHNGIVNKSTITELRKLIDAQFKNWMLKKYNSLHNHPPMPPVMLHHIPRNMAREIESSSHAKSALILIDGLALDQWVTLRNGMDISHRLTESSVFAWVPTLTSVSRQALFSAKSPYQFAKTIHTTSSEPKAWQQYWLEHGLDSSEIFYRKSLGTDDDILVLIDQLSDHRLRSVGLVINTVDDIMHGMKLGSEGMHNQIDVWANKGYLSQLIEALIGYGFTIHLTSDHGNVEALGCGKINEGAVADTRGERTRVYQTEALRTEVEKTIKLKSQNAIPWPQIGLPSDYWPIVMSGREAFVAKNEKIVGHGGISIEEVIVPYIKISRE